jgi:Arc/MetJ-type ribon-helix-helix transcriptional regulator
MPRSRNGPKNYKPGDPIHIVVTQEFVEDANRFFTYCRDRGYNPSQVIRQAMVDWLDKEENKSALISPASSESNDMNGEFDDKIMDLVKERKKTRTKMSLRSVKEILEKG